MLARPTRRETYHRALGSGELIPQNEKELRRSEGSGMLIGRAVTVAVTTASPAVVGCHRGCVLPPAVVHVTSHTL